MSLVLEIEFYYCLSTLGLECERNVESHQSISTTLIPQYSLNFVLQDGDLDVMSV